MSTSRRTPNSIIANRIRHRRKLKIESYWPFSAPELRLTRNETAREIALLAHVKSSVGSMGSIPIASSAWCRTVATYSLSGLPG